MINTLIVVRYWQICTCGRPACQFIIAFPEKPNGATTWLRYGLTVGRCPGQRESCLDTSWCRYYGYCITVFEETGIREETYMLLLSEGLGLNLLLPVFVFSAPT